MHEQEQKIAQERGRLGALKDGRHNAGFDLDIDARVLQGLLQIRIRLQQRLILLELGAALSDDAIASCQVYQGLGISSCRCSAPQSSPPLPLCGQRGASLTAPLPLPYACRSTPASIHAHACTSVRPGSLPQKKYERRQERSLNFRNWGNDASIFC